MSYAPPPDLVWVEPDFAIGSLPYSTQRPLIAGLGIGAVVSLLTPSENEERDWAEHGVRFASVPTLDWVSIPHDHFERVVLLVEGLRRDQLRVLLHCAAGVNRAPTLAAAVLCHRHGLSIENALQIVRRARPAAAPTPEQAASLQEWLQRRKRSGLQFR